MANFTYTTDLIDDIMQRAGEPDDGSSDFEARSLRYLNRAYLSICKGGAEYAPEINEDWLWLKKRPPGVLTLLPKITGTANVSNNSTSVILSAAPSVSVVNYFFVVTGDSTWYRVSTQAGVNVTLDSVYVESSNSAASYSLYCLEYSLASDFLRLSGNMGLNRLQRIDGVPLETLESNFPLTSLSESYPQRFAFVTDTIVRFSHSVTEMTRVEYPYLKRPTLLTGSANEEPLVPIDYRHILADIALFYILIDKHSDKAAALPPIISNGLRAMQKDNKFDIARMNGQFASTYPRKKYNKYKLTQESGLFIPTST